MTTLAETDELDTLPLAISQPCVASLPPVRVSGKFFFAGERKHFVKGVTYGPFPTGSHGAPFPEPATVDLDFALMGEAGINTVRVFTVPPLWLLDAAQAEGLRVLVGLPWPQHVTFLDSRAIQADIRDAVVAGVRACCRHPAVFAYLVGNEIPPDMIRWHGAEPVRRFLRGLVALVKAEHPEALVSYANFPSTEYLTVDFTDFVCFNVYLHDQAAFLGYIARLHNLCRRPTAGADRIRRRFRSVKAKKGSSGFCPGRSAPPSRRGSPALACFPGPTNGSPAATWSRTGRSAWSTGSGGRNRRWPRSRPPIAARCRRRCRAIRGCRSSSAPTTPSARWMRASPRSKCSTTPITRSSSSMTVRRDRTLEIAESYPYCRIISQPNKGLSVARNVGAEAASGEIVAYTDSDCVADPDWLTYLVAKMEAGGLAACGGPNFPPPEDSLVPAAVAVSPGGPTHVLLSDEVAEHIAGCNMAFRRDALLDLGGFDPVYRAAGDDVDICWRIQDAGYVIGFSPAAIVWHFRRNTVKAYFNQQRGYGKAEALVYSKHPFRFNRFGQAKWLGRIYGDLSTSLLLSRRPVIYSGVFGRGLFQTLYEPPSSLDRVSAADLRVERRCPRPGTGRGRRRRLVVAARGAATGHLDDVRQRGPQSADRRAVHRIEGSGAGGAADLSRADCCAAGSGSDGASARCAPARTPPPPRPSSARMSRGVSEPSNSLIGAKAEPKKKR